MSAAALALAADLLATGQFAQAEAAARRLLRRLAADPAVCSLLGRACYGQGKLDQAEHFLRRAAGTRPEAGTALSALLRQRFLPVAAEQAALGALALAPDDPQALLQLAAARAELGDPDAAIAAAGRTLDLCGPSPALAQTYLSLLQYSPTLDPRRQADLHRQLGSTLGGPRINPPPPAAPRPDGRRRIGYLSPDLRRHVLMFFIEPLLRGHDRSRWAVFAYHTGADDAVSRHLATHCDGWRNAAALSDDALARHIRTDGIDVLVDLCGHLPGNRLGVLAARAAPVQLTYAGYPQGTGLASVDGRIVDAITDPPSADALCADTPARLDRCFLAYDPGAGGGELGAAIASAPTPPPRATGPVVFASFNAMTKLNAPLLRLWGRLVSTAPAIDGPARLLIKNRWLGDPALRSRVLAELAASGLPSHRVELVGFEPDGPAHLNRYAQADIALDSFPYHGTTTTCETLWMGVPVVSLAGASHVSRVGASLLAAVGLPELAAADEASYIAAAHALAADTDRRAALRATLRQRLKASPLCDGQGLARAVESLYERLLAPLTA